MEKAIRIAGMGSDNLRLIDVDSEYAMKPEHLEWMPQILERLDRAWAASTVDLA